MSNDKAFKIKNGISVGTAYQQTGGTVTSAATSNDLKTANLDGTFYVGTQTTAGQDVFFKPDGLKMYVSGDDRIYQYSLSTAWDVSTASYDSKTLGTSTTTGTNLDHFFIGDSGTKVYVLRSDNANVYRYDLSTAWDISSGSYSGLAVNTTTGAPSSSSAPFTVNFSSDGTKMYVHMTNPYDSMYQYDLSSAWNVSTASYSKRSIPISFVDDVFFLSYEGLIRGLRFSNDGTEMFAAGKNTLGIYKFGLTTAWDISTLYYTGESTLDYFQREFGNASGAVENNMSGLALNTEDGSTFYRRGQQRSAVYQFTGAGATKTLDLSSGTYFKINATTGTNIAFSNPPPSGVAYAATIEVASDVAYNIAPAYMTAYFNSQDADGDTSGNGITFKPDGTKMYLVGQSQDTAHQYSLSVPWDIKTATLETEYNVSVSGNVPEAIQFKPDGTAMYILNSSSDSVYQFTLSVPWYVDSHQGSATSFSVASQEASPTGLFFKPDGTRMFVTGTATRDINEYSLSTAWDVTTASFVQAELFPKLGTYTPTSGDPHPFFTSDGTRLFLSTSSYLLSFPLTTAWDVSTIQLQDQIFTWRVNVGINNGDVFVAPRALYISPTFDRVFVYGARDVDSGSGSDDSVASFDFAAPYKLSWPSTVKWDQNISVTPPDQGASCFYTIFTVDGGATYYAKVSGGNVR